MGKLRTRDEGQKIPFLGLKQTVPLGPYQPLHLEKELSLYDSFRGEEPKAAGWGRFLQTYA